MSFHPRVRLLQFAVLMLFVQENLGMAVRPLSPAERRNAGVKDGLVVEGVSGPAEMAGIQPGDIVLSVNGSEVTSVHHLRKLVDGQGQQVALLIARHGVRPLAPIPLA